MDEIPKSARMYQSLKAGVDANGNGRRVIILLDAKGDIVQTRDGYAGVPQEISKKLVQLPELDVTPATVRALKRWPKL